MKNHTVRIFVANLLIYVLLTSQVAPMSFAFSAANGSATPNAEAKVAEVANEQSDGRSGTSFAPVPVPLRNAPAAVAPIISASKTDSFADSDGDGKAEPGEIITYSITVSNTGPDPALNLTLNDTVDANTTLIGGSVHSTPIGVNDAFNVLGNVRIQVPDGASDLLANDTDPENSGNSNAGLTITTLGGDNSAPFSGTSANGGQVTATTGDGSFQYDPPPGFTGTDTFTYTTTDSTGGGTSTATVTLTVTGLIWFINSAAAAGGNGRLTAPFNCYTGTSSGGQTCFSDTAADDPGDIIFLYSGNYTGGFTLLNNQRLIGQGATDTLANIGGVTTPTFSDALPTTGGANPVITTAIAATNAIPLGQGNLLRGFTVGNTTAAKIFGNNFTTLTVGNIVSPDVLLNGTGMALNLTNGTFAATSAFNSVTTSSSTAQGIFLSQVAGTVNLGSTTVSGSTTQGILVQQSTGNINFGNTVVGTGVAGSGGTNAVSLQNNSAGTRTFGTLTIQNINGPANSAFLSGAGGGNTVAGTTSISGVAGTGHGIDIQSLGVSTSVSFGNTAVTKASPGSLVNLASNAGNVSFLSLGGTNTNGSGLVGTENTGSITVTNNTGSITTTLGPALSITKAGAPATPIALNFTTLSSTNSGTQGVNLDRVSGNMTVGTTTTTNPTGIGISVTNTGAGGTMNFGNTTSNTSAGAGVNLGTNAGAVTFADLDIAPDPTVAAFVLASSTGTTTSTSGTISTTDALAVSVNNSPLNMTLTSVSADNTGDADSCVSLTTASGTLNMQGGTLTGGTGAVFLVSGGNPTVTYSGSITQNSTGRVVDIQGTTGNTITFNTGTITGGASSLGVHIADTTAVNGNVTFSNGLTLGTSGARMTNQAVTIGAGTGTFSLGAVSIFTSSAQGIVATNADGTLNTTSGTVDATTARAINIDGPAGLTTLGMTLTRVVSTNSTTNGITILDTNGTFTVTGSAGNCTVADQTCTGGSIQTTTAEGILLTTVTGINLAFMKIQNSGTDSIHATTVNGFTLNNSIVTDSAGTASHEGIELDNASGTVTISNCAVSNAPHNGIDVDNFNTNMTAFNLTNSAVTCAVGNACQPAGAVGNDGLLLHMRGTSVLTTGNVQNSTFSGHRATAVQVQTSDTAIIASNDPASANNFTVQTSSFTGNNIAMDFTVAQGSSNKFKVLNNATITGHNSHAINVFSSATSLAAARIIGKIQGNTIGTQGSRDSGSRIGNGIRVVVQGSSQGNVEVDANTIREVVNANVILAVGQNGNAMVGTGSAKFKITNNVMPAPSGSNQNLCGPAMTPCAENGIFILADEAEPVCAVVTGNNIYDVTTMNGSFDVYLAERAGPPVGAQLTIEGAGAVTTFINANNTLAGANKSFDEGGNVTTTASCSFPVLGLVEAGGLSQDITGTTIAASAEAIASSEAQGTMNIEPKSVVAFAGADDITGANVGITGTPFVSSPRSETNNAAEPSATQLVVNSGVKAKVEDKSALSKSNQTSKPATKLINPTPPVVVGDNLTWNIGTLPAGQSVTITFQVTVDNPYTGPANVSNQGTVTADGGISVLTDDPSVGGGADPTLTPIDAPPDINIKDAKVGEPASGQTSMLFTVVLSAPATGPVSVNFATANGGATPATGGATCDGIADYLTTNGTANFTAGEQIQTIAVPVCSDATVEGDETFLVNLSTPTNGIIVDGTATGTITPNTPGVTLISEVRTSGPSGLGDDFVEIYNNTNSPLTVTASDASAGYGLFKMGTACGAAPVLIGTIPNGTVIPARGHYLLVGSAYSLANYGGTGAAAGNLTMSSDIENDRNVALFNTSNILNISSTTRLDAVGFGANTGNNCDLLREGTNLGALLGSTLEYSFVRKLESGTSQDTNDNAADFVFIDTTATLVGGAGQRLGAPGPENLASPLQRNATIKASLIDTGVASTSPPNRIRDTTSDPANNSTFGTLLFRRKFTNNTGAPVTRLRFRIVDVTTAPVPAGTADLRARTIGPAMVTITGGSIITVQGTVLETPPAQAMAGGLNSTLSAVTVTLAQPIAAGASINVQLLTGVQATGSFRFFINVEALP